MNISQHHTPTLVITVTIKQLVRKTLKNTFEAIIHLKVLQYVVNVGNNIKGDEGSVRGERVIKLPGLKWQ